MFTESQKIKTTKALLSGAFLAGTTMLVYGGQGSATVLGTQVPVVVPLFTAGALASVSNDLFHDYVLGKPTPDVSFAAADLSSTITSAAIGGALAGGILYYGSDLQLDKVPHTIFLGGASLLAADYVETKYLTQSGHLIF